MLASVVEPEAQAGTTQLGGNARPATPEHYIMSGSSNPHLVCGGTLSKARCLSSLRFPICDPGANKT